MKRHFGIYQEFIFGISEVSIVERKEFFEYPIKMLIQPGENITDNFKRR